MTQKKLHRLNLEEITMHFISSIKNYHWSLDNWNLTLKSS